MTRVFFVSCYVSLYLCCLPHNPLRSIDRSFVYNAYVLLIQDGEEEDGSHKKVVELKAQDFEVEAEYFVVVVAEKEEQV
ncbi:hypothetical protein VNO77_21784 [Canavalia gladiata]|uniref:Uncharacterized protein n=1 Tax=Canavalia gladiata TaxID=3824 RepID=A0AAN9Q9W9_CANGL